MAENIPKNAGAPEIELTPAMIEAGVKVCADIYGICGESLAESLAEDMFKAMMAARINQSQSMCRAQTSGRNS